MNEHVVAAPRRLGRRVVPLQIAVGLSGMGFWVPVEKLFMTQIGFTPQSVAIMAAAYAAVVPLLEVPSGILADRWSRSRLMMCACIALFVSTLLGGLSHNVPTYIAAAMLLGIYFALSSGTVDSIVYDVVMEETGSSDQYESWIGRVRMVESGSLVISALVGGVLAGWVSARATYFASLPFAAAAVLAFLLFAEPRLHRAAEPVALRRHLALTFRTMIQAPGVRQVMLLAALAAMLSQAVFEYGPLWLVALAASAVVFGPYWAAVVSTLGVGGYITGKLNLDRPLFVTVLALAAPIAAFLLTQTRSLAAVIVAQALLALLLAIIGIRAGKLLHDGVPSNIRAGVSSGAGTLSWLLFLPFSLVFGWFARAYGVQPAGWFLTGAALLIAALLIASAIRRPTLAQPAPAAEIACQQLVEAVTDYLDGVLPAELRAEVRRHLDGCGGCTEYVRQIRLTIDALRQADLRIPVNPVTHSGRKRSPRRGLLGPARRMGLRCRSESKRRTR